MQQVPKPLSLEVLSPLDPVSSRRIREVRTGGYELPFNEYWLSFSRCDPEHKYTPGVERCLVPVLVGTSLDGGTEISCIAHISTLMEYFRGSFDADFRRQLEQFCSLTEHGTRTAGIVGGFLPDDKRRQGFLSSYIRRIARIGEAIKSFVGIDATVLAGPTREPGSLLNVYLHTRERIVGVLPDRHNTGCESQPFLASEVQDISKNW